MYIAIDFDGTCVTHEYPRIGKDIGAVPILKRLLKANHKLILYTMRSGIELNAAVKWFKKNKIELFSINNNPTQAEWTSSNKIYANLYIDDAALGCPLKCDESLTGRSYVDWDQVEKKLIKESVIMEITEK